MPGSIHIDANRGIAIRNSEITTVAARSDGGDITLKSERFIDLKNSSRLTSEANSNGGNIQVNTPILRLSDSDISASAGINGGNLEIDNTATVLDGASILANATVGNGGNITISTDGLFQNHDKVNSIDASSEFGLSGTIVITTPEIDLTAGLVPLTEDFLNVDSLSFAKCSTRFERGEISTFQVIHREGIPLAPDDLLPSYGLSRVGNSDLGTHADKEK